MPKLSEKDIYDEIKNWLISEYGSAFDEYYPFVNQQIYYGKAMRTGFDIMVVGFDVHERRRKPSEWCATDIYICECKLLWSAYAAFGQLAFYESIVENYMKSGHWKDFNKDYYYGPLRYFENKKALPRWFKEDGKDVVYYLNDKINLQLYLVLYCENSKDLETREYVKFIEDCLSRQTRAGLVTYCHDRTRNKIELKNSPQRLQLTHGRRQKPVYNVEDACAIPSFPTKQSCRLFTQDGKYGKMSWRGECRQKIQGSCVGCESNW